MSSAVTVVVGGGFGDIGSESTTGPVLGGAVAQARTSPIIGLNTIRERAVDLTIGEI
ncbi:MAG: hypothetical protein M3365_10875 [Gemmatimonadota bacterium]|nr:hypothetical protein [Gemmatimonadota bacterium]